MTTSIEFQTLLSQRPGPTTPPSPEEWTTAVGRERQLILHSSSVNGVLSIDTAGYLRTTYKPTRVVNDDGSTAYITVNQEDAILSPAMLEPKAFEHGITVLSRSDVPAWCISGQVLGGDLLRDHADIGGQHHRLVAFPLLYLVGHNKEHIEGHIDDEGLRDKVLEAHGQKALQWLNIFRFALLPEVNSAARAVFTQVTESLPTYLGDNHAAAKITDGFSS